MYNQIYSISNTHANQICLVHQGSKNFLRRLDDDDLEEDEEDFEDFNGDIPKVYAKYSCALKFKRPLSVCRYDRTPFIYVLLNLLVCGRCCMMQWDSFKVRLELCMQ